MGEREGEVAERNGETNHQPTSGTMLQPYGQSSIHLRFRILFTFTVRRRLVFPTPGRTQGKRFTGSPPLHTTYYRHLLRPECCGQCSTFGAVPPPARSLANGPPRFLGKGRSIETQRSDSLVRFPYERTSRAPNTRCPRERESLYFVSSGTTSNH
jgi:hypothetical protein